MKTNPNAILTCLKNSIFTNVGETADGGFFWEGLEDETPAGTEIISWTGERYKLGEDKTKKSSHPNARFCCPARQCPIIHDRWEDPAGVPISAIIFGGRRPEGVPLVIESLDWEHGIFLASQLKSETTAAAEHTGKQIMHDPFAMRYEIIIECLDDLMTKFVLLAIADHLLDIISENIFNIGLTLKKIQRTKSV